MTVRDHPPQVLIAGGGIAALELLLALRALAGNAVAITVLTPDGVLAPPAMSVAQPFRRGGALTYEWSQIAADQGARVVLDTLIAVDVDERRVFTHGGSRVPYDILAVATGARRVEPLPGAVAFGPGADAERDLRAIVDAVLEHDGSSIAFALASPATWPLPLYELALLTAGELRERACDAAVRIVTPEERPLELFGPAALDAIAPMLDALGIEVVAAARPRRAQAGELLLAAGPAVRCEYVVTLPDVAARPVAGLPMDSAGFIPVDLHGRVAGAAGIFAAGEATSFPLRQGGLATQQADAVAETIAAVCGARAEPAPFRPVLRGRMLTSGAPLYLQSRPSGQSVASFQPLWSPPEKVAGRYLAPYLSTARPPRVATAPLVERVPAAPSPPGDEHDAVTLALAIADAHRRCGDAAGFEQATEAARALEPDAGGVLAPDARDTVFVRPLVGDDPCRTSPGVPPVHRVACARSGPTSSSSSEGSRRSSPSSASC